MYKNSSSLCPSPTKTKRGCPFGPEIEVDTLIVCYSICNTFDVYKHIPSITKLGQQTIPISRHIESLASFTTGCLMLYL